MSVVNWKVPGALNRQDEQTGVITSIVLRCVCALLCVCVCAHVRKKELVRVCVHGSVEQVYWLKVIIH